MCDQQLFTQCETTQVRHQAMGAALFGYSELYSQVPGGQAELLRVPQAQITHMKVPEGPPDSRFVYLSDGLPTASQAVVYTESAHGGQHLPAAAKGTRYVGALVRYGLSVWTVWFKRGNADARATTSIADLARRRSSSR